MNHLSRKAISPGRVVNEDPISNLIAFGSFLYLFSPSANLWHQLAPEGAVVCFQNTVRVSEIHFFLLGNVIEPISATDSQHSTRLKSDWHSGFGALPLRRGRLLVLYCQPACDNGFHSPEGVRVRPVELREELR
jgi:hypothetical protein